MVNKLTLPSKENAVQEKVNEIIDNLGGGYSAGTGIDITNDVISVTSPTLTNTATGSNSLTIMGTPTADAAAFNIGRLSTAQRTSTSIGHLTISGEGSTSVGYASQSYGEYGTAIGNQSATSSQTQFAIQIGRGTNTESNSFYVSTSASDNWKMLGSDGLIPDARISSNIARTSAIPAPVTETTVSGWGFTKNTGTVTSVNNTSPDSNGNVTLSIPAAQVNSDWNANSGVAQILNKPTLGTMAAESASDYTPTSGLATVATSGAYSDLIGTPTIPTVNNATLTITQGGTTKGTFTANASSNVTIDLDAGGTPQWGNITGTLSNQTDLKNALDGKADVDLSNINASQSAKNTIVSWGIPDYTAGISVTANQDYTIPKSGELIISTRSGGQGNFVIEINGTQYVLANISWTYTNPNVYAYLTFEKDDVIKIIPNGAPQYATYTFYPFRGV